MKIGLLRHYVKHGSNKSLFILMPIDTKLYSKPYHFKGSRNFQTKSGDRLLMLLLPIVVREAKGEPKVS